MNPIHINLHNLTPELLEEARPHVGSCNYGSPCIIGVLIPPAERHELALRLELENERCTRESYDDYGRPMVSEDDVKALQMDGTFIIPKEQEADARAIQEYFDNSDWESVICIASKYMLAPGA